MTIEGRDWLAARAREGNPRADAYRLDEAYPGERADLVRELKTALSGCDEPENDRLGRAMLAAIALNALPVLRSVVAVWRDAYLGLLDHAEDAMPTEEATLDADERARLLVLKERLHGR